MADKLRMALVGAGMIVREAHIKSLKRLSDRVEVVAVYSRRLEVAKNFAKEHGIPLYTDNWREVIGRSDVDAVLIATPNYTHKPIAVEAAKSGKHIFLEKPIALSVEDGEAIVKEAESHGVKLLVGHCLRFWPEYVRIKKAVENGVIGEPRVARAYRLSSFPRWSQWHRYKEFSGGVVIDLGIHDLDYLRWVLGEPVEVYAVGGIRTRYSVDAIDYAMAIIKFRDGAIAYVESSWAMPENFRFYTYLEIAGTKGLLTVDNNTTATVTTYIDDSFWSFAPVDDNAYYLEMKAFLDWVQHDVKPPLEPRDAVESLRLALAIVKSIERGEVVKIAVG